MFFLFCVFLPRFYCQVFINNPLYVTPSGNFMATLEHSWNIWNCKPHYRTLEVGDSRIKLDWFAGVNSCYSLTIYCHLLHYVLVQLSVELILGTINSISVTFHCVFIGTTHYLLCICSFMTVCNPVIWKKSWKWQNKLHLAAWTTSN
jgi:hypothetical protein